MSTTNYIEERIARACIAELLEHGFSIDVNDGEETTLTACTDPAAILAAMFSTDEDYLHARRNTGPDRFLHGWVRFIYGNDCDVISDYTTNLDPYLKKTTTLVQELSSDPSRFLAEEAERATRARELLATLVKAYDDTRQFMVREERDDSPGAIARSALADAVALARTFLAKPEVEARHDDRDPPAPAPRFEEPHPLERIGALRHAIDLIELAHGTDTDEPEIASTLNTLRELVDATEIKTEAPAPGWGQMLDAEITLTTAHGLPQRMTFRDFLDANRDTFTEAEVEQMRAALSSRTSYRGGGGASPEWTIEIA
jgi:hypothetical protein